MRLAATLSLALICLPIAVARSQDEAVAARVNGEAPVVDGRLDDEAWRYAPAITDFLQRNPIEGAAPSESTEVRFAYTDRDLYVAFRGWDRDPDRVYGRLVRRDQRTSADQFSLFLDSYHDGRTAFEFSFNPSGARRDVFIFADGAGRDDSWDPVYDWAAMADSLGWTVELRIPFSQLRFAVEDSLVFGLRLRRSINRRNEEVNWPFFPRDQAGEVSRYGRLVGLAQVPRPKRAELLPYVAGSSSFYPEETDNPFATGRDSDFRVGGDGKFGVTSGLTLDLTVNPDFGQVQADPAVVNLTEFEAFFPERRPFFIEGTDLFQFGLSPRVGGFGPGGGGGGGRGQEGLVYTRRIGRNPQVPPDALGGYAEPVNQTTILTAAKLSGNLGKGWAFGVMEALTAKEWSSVVDSLGTPGASPVEPFTSYTALRAMRTVNRGRLTYGLVGTATIRRLDEPRFGFLHRNAFTGGLDARGRFGRDRYEFNLAAMGSRVAGSTEALALTQISSARYYQRPDADYVELDTTRTSLSGFSGYGRLAKVVGFVAWDLRAWTRSPGFEINDLGFQRQADQHQERAELELRWLQPGTVFRQFELTFEQMASWTYGWERTRTSFQTRADGDFLNYWSLNGSAEVFLGKLEPRLLRGGAAFLEPHRWEFRLGGRTNFRRPVWVSLGGNYAIEPLTGADSWGLNGGIRWRPPGSFSMSVELRLGSSRHDRQYITQRTPDDADSTYFVLGELDRQDISMEIRADFAITPRLSLEIYAEPFGSAGAYDVIKLAADPKARNYEDRFDPLGPDRMNRPGGEEDVQVDVDGDGNVDFEFSEPDFRVVSFRTNVVLRWEFRPGSTLFVVWQQNRGQDFPGGPLRLTTALVDAFDAPGTHVFAVKLAYWFGL